MLDFEMLINIYSDNAKYEDARSGQEAMAANLYNHISSLILSLL